MGQMLLQAYEVFQIDVGLQGIIFTRCFMSLSKLSAEHWFFDMWRLCLHFNVSLTVHATNDIPLVREGDRSLME